MATKPKPADPASQMDKFRDIVRELECDDEERFDERLRKIATAGRPKQGHWRIDFAIPHGHRANFYPVDRDDSWRSSPVFTTPQAVATQ